MRILNLTTHLNTGGITSYLLTLSRRMVDAGHKVCIASSGGNMEETFRRYQVDLLSLNIQTKSELSPRIYISLLRLLRFVHREKIDIIHSHTRVTQVLGYLLGKISGIPYVSTCHGFYKNRLSRRLWPCWGDAVIAISPAVEECLTQKCKMPPEKVFMVKNSIYLEDFHFVDDAYRHATRQSHRMPDDPVIGIIARLADVKGHEVLIRAMPTIARQVPKAKLFIVGQGKMEEWLKRLTVELGLGDQVCFFPTVNQSLELLPLLDVFVMPSLEEGLGLSVIEAQAFGLPVVASAVGGILSLIEDGKTGVLVPPGDSAALARAVIDLLNDHTKAQEIGRRARESVISELTNKPMFNKTLHVYERVLSRAHKGK